MNVTASAPGKLFLLGEYSVLAGGGALLMATAQRAVVKVYPAEQPRVYIRADEEREATFDETAILGSVPGVMKGRGLDGFELPKGHAIELDTRAFFHEGRKLGMGSSAALMVAILRAFLPRMSPGPEFLDVARECHSAFQGGVGSGADIATAMSGGCIHFENGAIPAPVTLPGDLEMLFIWTGQSASTPAYVRGFNQWRSMAPPADTRLVDELGDLCRRAIDDLGDRQTEAFIGKVRQFNQGLAELSNVAELGFYTRPHLVLCDLVEQHGLAYKPSGAGGGDFGIAFTADRDRMEQLVKTLNDQGYLTLSPVVGRESEVCFEE